MSQYPPPYPPAPQPPVLPPYPPGEDPRRPARRAAILMGVIGALGLIAAGMIVAVARVMTPEMIAAAPNAAQIQRQIEEARVQAGLTWDGVRRMFMVAGIVMAVPSVLFIVLAFFVRGGGRVVVTLGLIVSVLAAVFLAFQGLVGAAMGGGDPGGACVTLVAVGLLILLCNWLWQAVRAAPYVEALRRLPVPIPPPAWPAPPGYPAYPPQGYGQPWQPPAAPPDYRAYLQPPAPPPAGGQPVVYGYAQAPEAAAPQASSPPVAGEAAPAPPAAGSGGADVPPS